MISEISPFKDFVCIKVCHNRRVRCFGIVLVCPCLYTNRTSKELQTLLSLFFFSKFELPNRGCGLSTGAAYTRNFTVLSRRPIAVPGWVSAEWISVTQEEKKGLVT